MGFVVCLIWTPEFKRHFRSRARTPQPMGSCFVHIELDDLGAFYCIDFSSASSQPGRVGCAIVDVVIAPVCLLGFALLYKSLLDHPPFDSKSFASDPISRL